MWGARNATDAIRRARFDKLVLQHSPTLEAVARKLCRDPSATADLLQGTFERAWRRFDSLHDDERARAWLVQIMRNIWLDQLRRRRTEVPIEEATDLAAAAVEEPSRWERVTIDDVHRAIEQLGEPFRSVAVLHDIDGLSHQEIAARLGIPYATAATRLHRAHRQLKELMLGKLDKEREHDQAVH